MRARSKATGSSPSPAGSALDDECDDAHQRAADGQRTLADGHDLRPSGHLADRLPGGGGEQAPDSRRSTAGETPPSGTGGRSAISEAASRLTRSVKYTMASVEREQQQPVEGGRAEPRGRGRRPRLAAGGRRRVRRRRRARGSSGRPGVGRPFRALARAWRAAAGSGVERRTASGALGAEGRTSGSSPDVTSPNSGRSLAPGRDDGGTPGSSDGSWRRLSAREAAVGARRRAGLAEVEVGERPGRLFAPQRQVGGRVVRRAPARSRTRSSGSDRPARTRCSCTSDTSLVAVRRRRARRAAGPADARTARPRTRRAGRAERPRGRAAASARERIGRADAIEQAAGRLAGGPAPAARAPRSRSISALLGTGSGSSTRRRGRCGIALRPSRTGTGTARCARATPGCRTARPR